MKSSGALSTMWLVTSFLFSGEFKADESTLRTLSCLAASGRPDVSALPAAREVSPTPAVRAGTNDDVSSVVDRYTVLSYL